MVVARVTSFFCTAFALALACSSDPASPGGTGGSPGTGGKGGANSGGASSGGAGGSSGSTTAGSVSGGGSAGGAAGASAGNSSGGSTTGGAGAGQGGTTAGQSGGGANSSGGGGTSGLPAYAGPGVGCVLGKPNAEENRCDAGQTCCQIRFGATHCGANAAACEPCTEPGECTTIACDEPADCPVGVCCATLSNGLGAVEFSQLGCQSSCTEDQYVICATDDDCPTGFTECGISSMGIRRCFH